MRKNIFDNSKIISVLRNKAFTLIELLAIIVILAIIAVITVPIILNVIENAKSGASINSAYGYCDSIYKEFFTGLTLNADSRLIEGVYIIDSTGKLVNSNGNVLNVNVSGLTPDEGWVQLGSAGVVAYSLRFGDYVVTKYQDTEVASIKNGDIADNVEIREARLELERQTNAIVMAKNIALSQTGMTEIKDIINGWVAFIDENLLAYSIKVNVDNYTYVVTDLDVTNENINAVADRTIDVLASKATTEQEIVSYKVDSYVKAALSASLSVDSEEVYMVSEIAVTTNVADSGWIHFKSGDSAVTVVDYSLSYGDYTANYSSFTDGNYVSMFGDLRDKPSIVTIGNEVCYGSVDSKECFKIINKFTQNGVEKALLLANYGLKKITDNTTDPAIITYKQSLASATDVKFSASNYWHDTSVDALKNDYAKDINGDVADYSSNTPLPYVYDENSYTYAYVEGYVSYLKNTCGVSSSITGRLLTFEESNNRKIFPNSASRGSYYYWLGSALDSKNVRYIFNGSIAGNPYYDKVKVRPVIEIPISDVYNGAISS